MSKISPIKYPTLSDIKENSDLGKPCVLIFLSEWCPACQEYKPVVEYYAEKYEKKVSVYIVRPENVKKLSKIFPCDQIKYIPYTFFILGKTVMKEIPGSLPFDDFKLAIENLYNMATA